MPLKPAQGISSPERPLAPGSPNLSLYARPRLVKFGARRRRTASGSSRLEGNALLWQRVQAARGEHPRRPKRAPNRAESAPREGDAQQRHGAVGEPHRRHKLHGAGLPMEHAVGVESGEGRLRHRDAEKVAERLPTLPHVVDQERLRRNRLPEGLGMPIEALKAGLLLRLRQQPGRELRDRPTTKPLCQQTPVLSVRLVEDGQREGLRDREGRERGRWQERPPPEVLPIAPEPALLFAHRDDDLGARVPGVELDAVLRPRNIDQGGDVEAFDPVQGGD
mmetsp:Transcript_93165/g.268105  ORF Transcript_93165/g.268105 Transcript_93165/m.268105 type:complete len:278 (-) Transcript_93165:317-1150(-)